MSVAIFDEGGDYGAVIVSGANLAVTAERIDDVADAAALLGLYDAAPVSHEPFRQWVIEDRFGDAGRPVWEKAGAQLVSDVAPYEHMKLRLLNGAHSALAYLGYLAGHETIPDAAADPVFRRHAQALWGEIIPVVPAPPGVDLHGYAAELQARFSNTANQHRTWQIAIDGSQKLPQRLLSTVRDRIAAGLPIRRLACTGTWSRACRCTNASSWATATSRACSRPIASRCAIWRPAD